MTDKQFQNAFTTAGGWFIVSQYRFITESRLETQTLLNRLFNKGFDSDLSGTKARLGAFNRLIRGNRIQDAMEKIRDSQRINSQHPEARNMAQEILDSL